MDEHAAVAAEPGDLGHRLQRTDLVVGEHDRDQDRVLGEDGLHLGRINPTMSIDADDGESDEALHLHGQGDLEDRRMFDGGDHHVAAAARRHDAAQREIVGFRTTRGEDDLVGAATEAGCNLGPRPSTAAFASRPKRWPEEGLP